MSFSASNVHCDCPSMTLCLPKKCSFYLSYLHICPTPSQTMGVAPWKIHLSLSFTFYTLYHHPWSVVAKTRQGQRESVLESRQPYVPLSTKEQNSVTVTLTVIVTLTVTVTLTLTVT